MSIQIGFRFFLITNHASVCVFVLTEILSVKFPKVKLLVREHVYFLILVNYTILLFKKSIKVYYSISNIKLATFLSLSQLKTISSF